MVVQRGDRSQCAVFDDGRPRCVVGRRDVPGSGIGQRHPGCPGETLTSTSIQQQRGRSTRDALTHVIDRGEATRGPLDRCEGRVSRGPNRPGFEWFCRGVGPGADPTVQQ